MLMLHVVSPVLRSSSLHRETQASLPRGGLLLTYVCDSEFRPEVIC